MTYIYILQSFWQMPLSRMMYKRALKSLSTNASMLVQQCLLTFPPLKRIDQVMQLCNVHSPWLTITIQYKQKNYIQRYKICSCPLTVFRHLQDVADERAVAIKGLCPCEVDGALLWDAVGSNWILWSMGELPVRGKRWRQIGLNTALRLWHSPRVQLPTVSIFTRIDRGEKTFWPNICWESLESLNIGNL